MEINKLKEEIKNITEPRRVSYGNIRHKLEDIIVIVLCTIICGEEDYADMEEFGIERKEWLQNFHEFPNGIPDSDTFRRLFERIKPDELSKCLNYWLEIEREKRSVIAIDGKTIRGSKNKNHKAYHVVSAFVAENQITLGEITVAEKTNEITAVPELLDLIDVENAIVTADAMSCQKTIVKKINKEKADYVIGLKGNQSTLLNDVTLYFKDFSDELPKYVTKDKGHGRIEIREYQLLTNISWLKQKEERENLQGVGIVKSIVHENEKSYEYIRACLKTFEILKIML